MHQILMRAIAERAFQLISEKSACVTSSLVSSLTIFTFTFFREDEGFSTITPTYSCNLNTKIQESQNDQD